MRDVCFVFFFSVKENISFARDGARERDNCESERLQYERSVLRIEKKEKERERKVIHISETVRVWSVEGSRCNGERIRQERTIVLNFVYHIARMVRDELEGEN